MTTRSLEDRIRDVEDRLEILNLVAAHPPGADTGADRVYPHRLDRGRLVRSRLPASDSRAASTSPPMSARPRTRPRSQNGIGHFAGLPHIAIKGDTAIVTSYLQILVPQTQGDPVTVPITARRRDSACTAWAPTAGTWCARPTAGRSRAACRVRSTATRRAQILRQGLDHASGGRTG